jgi:hypothetical protein
MLFCLLVFGSLWFWVALAIPALLLIAFVENEKAGRAFLTVLLTMGVLTLFSDVNPFAWVAAHPLKTVIGVIAYVGIGVVWSFGKWMLFVLRIRDKYEALRAKFVATHGPITETNKALLRACVGKNDPRLLAKPGAARNRGRIIFWMAYWPFSATWTIINDPITRFYRFAFNRLASSFQGVSDRMFAKYQDDF